MKILFITDMYPMEKANKDNITKALMMFVQEWKKMGHYVEVVRPNFIFNTFVRGHQLIKEKIYFENNTKIYNLNYFTPFWWNIRKKLPKDFSLNDYDVMISHMPSGALFALRLLEEEKIRYVCAVHSSDIVVLKDIKYAIYFKNKLQQAYLIADKVAARSPVLQKEIEQIIPKTQDKTFVAYSGSDFNINKQERKFDYQTLKICTVASLIRRKNIDIILKALARMNIDFELTIIGEGVERKKLEKLANKLDISSKVHFTGELEHSKVYEYLKNNDIFVLLSEKETFGLVYLEAMSAGNIVIAKRNDGIDGILQDMQNSFLVDTNVDELLFCLEKIVNLKETEIKKIRNNALETAMNMTLEKSAKNYLDYL